VEETDKYMSDSQWYEAGNSSTLRTNNLAHGPQVFRAIRRTGVGLRRMLQDLGFRQRNPEGPRPYIGDRLKHQIETSRNEVAIATFTASGVEERGDVDYLFQIVDAKTNKPIRTFTPDFRPLRSRTYTWEFDGRDYLSNLGERPFAEDGFYIGRIQLRLDGEASNILFEHPIRVIRRAARLLAVDGNRGQAALALMGRLTRIGALIPISSA